ncbi:MAG: Rieske 2Fe-2S domain-containing protein [Chloroflexi bacterium]|nr:Rieske 2Fe-2S domain-containing protein [Chloroflexota bacterium]
MLSREENEELCRVGPGTLMGDLLRQYWIPFLPSRELPEPDFRPIKVRLLGEDLIAFRDTEGRVGLLDENCPHRGANLFWARNEECGLRCVYHGWKFDVNGTCVDMPNEPEESDFKYKVKAVAYPVRELNGALWTYMGPQATPPPFPPFEVNTLPAEHVAPPHIMLEECNWVQGLEGDIDSSHIDWVHARLNQQKSAQPYVMGTFNKDKRPKLEVLTTDYGGVYSASRQWDESGTRWHRITQYLLPFHTMIAAGAPDAVHLRSWVPIDDEHHMLFSQQARLDRPITPEERAQANNPFKPLGGYVPQDPANPLTRYLSVPRLANSYNIDLDLQKKELVFGVPFVGNLQDRAMTEAMGPIYKRWKEHLGSTDAMVIFVRRRLLGAAHNLRESGAVPGNVHDPSINRVRPASILLPPSESWSDATMQSRLADAGAPIAWVPMIQ